MESNWKEIAISLQKHKNSNSKEDIFENEIIACLKLLGWRETNGSIQRQKDIPIGNNNSIRIDILLKKNESTFLPIEIKRPLNICTERQELQLLSYMRQLKSQVGLLIGDTIRLYYDSPDDNMPFLILESQIDPSDPNGVTLCNLINYSSASINSTVEYSIAEYNKLQSLKVLEDKVSAFFNNAEENIKDLIVQYFNKSTGDLSHIRHLIENYTITVNRTYPDKSGEDNVYPVPLDISIEIPVRRYDSKHYSLDGVNFYGKGKFVLHAIKQYVHDNPKISYTELNKVFPPELATSKTLQVIQLLHIAHSFKDKNGNSIAAKRYFIDEPIKLYDGTSIVINSQWGDPHFSNTILKRIQKLYKVYTSD